MNCWSFRAVTKEMREEVSEGAGVVRGRPGEGRCLFSGLDTVTQRHEPERTDFDTSSLLASSRCSHTRSQGETLHSGLAEEWAGGFLVCFWKMLIKVVHTHEPAYGLDSQNDDVVRRVWKSAQ